MAQRKPKEPLLAEVPRPRLSDEELMELFYSGQAREKKREKDKDESSENVRAGVGSVGKIPFKPDLEKPSVKEGIRKEPFHKEPLIKSPAHPEIRKPVEIYQVHEKSDKSLEILTDIRTMTGSIFYEQDAYETSNPPKGAIKEPSHEEPFLKKPVSEGPYKDKTSASLDLNRTRTLGEQSVPETFRRAFEILPTLGPLEQLLYLWFLNLSHAVGQPSCRATMALLQRATGISEKLVRETLRSLLGRGHLKLLDGGAAGRAALYQVAHPQEITERNIEGFLKEPFYREPSLKEAYQEKVPQGNLPGHIERESIIYTLSQKESFAREGSPQEGSQQLGSSRIASSDITVPPALMDSVLDRFYSMTGQLRISRQKRERSRAQLLDLLRQGFRIDDVLYTIDWAREHITTPIYSFGIIPEIIGQALGRREGARHERPHQRSQSPSPSLATREEERDHQRLAEIQASLTPEELTSIQREAEGLVEKEYGSHVPGRNTLIRIKMTDILRARYLRDDS